MKIAIPYAVYRYIVNFPLVLAVLTLDNISLTCGGRFFLSQVSTCSVLINLRNSVLNFTVFTIVFEFKIGFLGVNKHLLLPWQ